MKKIFTLICAGIIACSISSCGGVSETNSTNTQPKPNEATQSIDEKKTSDVDETSADKEIKTEENKTEENKDE